MRVRVSFVVMVCGTLLMGFGLGRVNAQSAMGSAAQSAPGSASGSAAESARGSATGSATGQAVEQMGVKDADSWVALVDSAQYAKSWQEAAPVFQAAVTADQWGATLKRVREPLGKLRSRIVQSATRTSKLPGVPDGQYVVILYQTSFDHKEMAQETVFLSRDKDKPWRVAGYYIK
ncbi:MAG: DUF4019 domain-containing protein [Acidobacteriota bacterium]|nr:DUF4019 domain-containing protein [Acidobacteriota bacterium]